jgi:cytochrome c oxidase accessory protein FixG
MKRGQSIELRQAEGGGDCVNCRACVVVCPTGIDIRNGTQMECVNCTACIDACDGIMDKIGRPHGLIRYASQNSIERGEKFRLTPRLAMYFVALAALAGVLAVLMFTRNDVETILLRAPGTLYTQLGDGRIENIYTVKVLNKTSRQKPIEFKLENTDGEVSLMGDPEFNVPEDHLAQTSLLIALKPESLSGPNTKLKIGVYSDGKRLETLQTVFVGPRPK